MKINQSGIDRECCKEMMQEGIRDASTQQGINFCVDRCPHPTCVLVEPHMSARMLQKASNRRMVKELMKAELTSKEMQTIMGISIRSIELLIKELQS